MNLLELAQSLLSGQPVAKAEPSADPDAPTPGGMSEEEMEAARKEAQAGQQAQAAAAPGGGEAAPGAAAPGAAAEPGAAAAPAPEPDGDENNPGAGDGDGDEVTKAEILKSIHFLADTYQLSGEEIAKSFSGLEGDPAFGKDPVGKGVDYLEGLLKKQGDILERIAGFLQELTGHTVKLGDQVAKSLEASEIAKSLAEKTSATVEALPKIATAKTPKGATAEEIVAKAEGGPGKEAKLTGEQLFKMALDPKCPLSPQDMARTNRAAQGTYGA